MKNMYARLAVGEDSRTEALANLLERILTEDRARNRARFSDFVLRVLLERATDEQQRAALVEQLYDAGEGLSLQTQYRTGNHGVPDMVIFVGEDPVCVVEVKIDAPVAEGQLETYGHWLADMAIFQWPALVLLTQFTPPPPGFNDVGNGGYGVGLRSVASWSAVAAWFAALGQEQNGADEPLKSLAGEFGEYLREENESMPMIDDVVAARQYLVDSKQRLSSAVAQMHAAYVFPNGWAGGNLREGKVGIWRRYRAGEGDNACQLYFGLAFKPTDENDELLYGYTKYENEPIDQPNPVDIGDGFYAFVYLWGTKSRFSLVPGFLNNCWYVRAGGGLIEANDGLPVESTGWWHYSYEDDDEAGYARIQSLQELLDGDGRLHNRFMDWSHESFDRSMALWDALF